MRPSLAAALLLLLRAPAEPSPAPAPARPPAPHGIEVAFPNGIACDLLVEGSDFLGIGGVRSGGIALRDPSTSIRPLVGTDRGGRYNSCRYLGHGPEGDAVVVRTTLVERSRETEDELRWILRPVEARLPAATFAGLSIAYEFRGRSGRAHTLVDRGTFEPGGTVEGGFLGSRRIERGDAFEEANVASFARGPAFDLLATAAGVLCAYRLPMATVLSTGSEERVPVGCETYRRKDAGDGRLSFEDVVALPAGAAVRVPPRIVLFAPAEDARADRLRRDALRTSLLDHVHAELRRDAGVAETEALPTAAIPELGPGRTFADALPWLDLAADLGFRRVYLACIWTTLQSEGKGGKSLSVIDLEVAASRGGVEGLRTFCDAAHARRLDVVAWLPCAHLASGSPLLAEHGDWPMRDEHGRPFEFTAVGGPLLDLRGSFFDYSVDRVRNACARGGIDGLWIDSFFVHAATRDHRASPPRTNEDRHVARARAFQGAGAGLLYAEGEFSAFALNGGWMDAARREPLEFRSSRMLTGDPGSLPEIYFGSIAAGSPPIVPLEWLDPAAEAKTGGGGASAAREAIRRANRDFLEVRSLLRRRTALREGRGFLWSEGSETPRVLFATRAFEGTAPAGRLVRDLSADAALHAPNGRFAAQAGHVYRFEDPPR
ncbi:MAG TPA: hypothetical protein VFI25_01740 [Planctomycetota bacterium]|jgi:hypothetical protein|nr:hypothetical protein [Planctomycetota bacterium]